MTRAAQLQQDSPDFAERFQAMVRERRSVREFTGERIEPALMQALFEAARWAPSSMNLQPYEIHWARTDATRAALVEACLGQRAAATAGELLVFVARIDDWQRVAREHHAWLENEPGIPQKAIEGHAAFMKKMAAALTLGPLGAVGLARRIATSIARLRGPVVGTPTSRSEMRAWATKGAAFAAENLVLAASAHGLATCMMEGFDPIRVARLLGLRGDCVIPLMVAVGRAADVPAKSPPWRRPVANVVIEH